MWHVAALCARVIFGMLWHVAPGAAIALCFVLASLGLGWWVRGAAVDSQAGDGARRGHGHEPLLQVVCRWPVCRLGSNR
jgi:hypothetical protein